MTLRAVTLIAVLCLFALPLAPKAAVAQAASAPAAVAGKAVPTVVPTAVRLGRGFGRGFGARPSTRVRSRSPLRRPARARRPLRRPGFGHAARNILRFLGIAWLVHALFGWGAGGSPFGLLLVLAVVAWIATRRRRRPAWDTRRGAF
jgi:hypothetical protein